MGAKSGRLLARVFRRGLSSFGVIDQCYRRRGGSTPLPEGLVLLNWLNGSVFGAVWDRPALFLNGRQHRTFADGATIHGSYNSMTGVLTLAEAAGGTAMPSAAPAEGRVPDVRVSRRLRKGVDGRDKHGQKCRGRIVRFQTQNNLA